MTATSEAVISRVHDMHGHYCRAWRQIVCVRTPGRWLCRSVDKSLHVAKVVPRVGTVPQVGSSASEFAKRLCECARFLRTRPYPRTAGVTCGRQAGGVGARRWQGSDFVQILSCTTVINFYAWLSGKLSLRYTVDRQTIRHDLPRQVLYVMQHVTSSVLTSIVTSQRMW